jgi:hypothetical protein
MPGSAWTAILLFVLSCIAGMTSVHHPVQPFIETGSDELFAQTGLEPSSNHDPCYFSLQLARIIGVSYHTQFVPYV